LTKTLKETNKERICILKTTGIDELYACSLAVVIDTIVVYPLTEACNGTCTIILYYLIIDIAATMAVLIKVIIAQMNFIAILTKALDLIVDFFTYTTDF
jgi:hypothetical protein